MSTDYRPLKEIAACDLFDGRLEELGVRVHVKQDENTGEEVRMLTDGRNYLWVYVDDDGPIWRGACSTALRATSIRSGD